MEPKRLTVKEVLRLVKIIETADKNPEIKVTETAPDSWHADLSGTDIGIARFSRGAITDVGMRGIYVFINEKLVATLLNFPKKSAEEQEVAGLLSYTLKKACAAWRRQKLLTFLNLLGYELRDIGTRKMPVQLTYEEFADIIRHLEKGKGYLIGEEYMFFFARGGNDKAEFGLGEDVLMRYNWGKKDYTKYVEPLWQTVINLASELAKKEFGAATEIFNQLVKDDDGRLPC